MKKQIGLLVLLLFMGTMSIQSENIGKIKLEWNYSGTLHNVLKAIGDDYNLKFVYDSLKLGTIEVRYYAFEGNTLSELFQDWQRQWNLVTYMEKDRTIIISDHPLTVRQRKEQIYNHNNNTDQDK